MEIKFEKIDEYTYQMYIYNMPEKKYNQLNKLHSNKGIYKGWVFGSLGSVRKIGSKIYDKIDMMLYKEEDSE